MSPERVGVLVCVAVATCASGCGLPLPLDNAEKCATNLYRAPGSAQLCDKVVAGRDLASGVTGIDLSKVLIYVSDQEDGAEVGYPGTWGVTQNGTMWIANRHLRTMVHEAHHAAGGQSGHCDWSVRYLDEFNTYAVAGSFNDDCRHVHCTTTRAWIDADGLFLGDDYVCR